MSPAAENVIERLDATRQKWWLVSLLASTVLAACGSVGLFMGFMAADALMRLPRLWLVAMAAAWTLVTVAMAVAVGRRLLRGERGLEATARRVETEFPELGNSLINLVQLSDGTRRVPDTSPDGTRSVPDTLDQAFREAAVRQAAGEVDRVRFDRAAAKESRWRRFVHCMQTPRDLAEAFLVLAALVAVALLCRHWLPNWGSAFVAALGPLGVRPLAGIGGDRAGQAERYRSAGW